MVKIKNYTGFTSQLPLINVKTKAPGFETGGAGWAEGVGGWVGCSQDQPITTLLCFVVDIQKILQEEQSNKPEDGWSFVKKTDFCEVWRKNERDKPVHLIKVRIKGEREKARGGGRRRRREREMSLSVIPPMQGFLNFPGIPPEKGENTIVEMFWWYPCC